VSVELVERRLAVMPEVAAVKFRQQQAIADPARERVVIEQSVAEARALQLEPEAARALFAVQIRLARAVQEHWFERWRTRGEQPPAARDLVTVLRLELDGIGRESLPAVYLASPALVALPAATLRERVARLGRQPGAPDDLIGELAQALGGLRLTAAPTWATVQKVGVLRVERPATMRRFRMIAAASCGGSISIWRKTWRRLGACAWYSCGQVGRR